MWAHYNFRIALPVLVLGLAVGGACGWFLTNEYLEKQWLRLIYSGAASEARLGARVLQKLRQGEPATALKILEAQLDGNLITIGAISDHISPQNTDEEIFSAIDDVRQYRKQYPSDVGTPQVQDSLSKALSLKRPNPDAAP